MTARRLLPLIVILLGFLAAAGATIWVLKPSSKIITSSVGGPFALMDENNRPVTEAVFAKKVALVFFGYTHCPDVCPTTLYDLSQVLAKIPADAPLTAAFITVDPERDTPATLKDYLSSFDPRIHGFSGSRAATEAVERAYRVYAKRVEGSQPDQYTYDHTALVYVMDKDGNFTSALNLNGPPEQAAKELQTLLF